MNIQQDVDLAPLHTLRLPSRARYFIAASDDREVLDAVRWAQERELAVLVLGEGSNLVLPRQLNALVLQLSSSGFNATDDPVTSTVTIDVAAGENWHRFVTSMLANGYYGLENLALIPGTVGAAPVQNIGAYGKEIDQHIVSVRVLDTHTGVWSTLARDDCQFSYRHSVFKERPRRYIITRVCLELSRTPVINDTYAALRAELDRRGIEHPTPRELFDAVVTIRQQKLPNPATLPNAGSFFKNPLVDMQQYQALRQQYPGLVAYPQGDDRVKLAAGWLIERAGFKGLYENGVGMHHQQALVLVNAQGADADAVLAYANKVVSAVHALFGVNLEREPLKVNTDGHYSAT
jgi:UDP-N-acetylmuramate dehydrogenase